MSELVCVLYMSLSISLCIQVKKISYWYIQIYTTGYCLNYDCYQLITASKMVANNNILNVNSGHENVIAFILFIIYASYTKESCR